MLSSWTKFLFAATPENALGASVVVHVAALTVMAVWTIGRIAEPPHIGCSQAGLQLRVVIVEPLTEPPAVQITTELPPTSQPPDPKTMDRRLTSADTLPPIRDEKVELVEELVLEPVLVRPRSIARREPLTQAGRQSQAERPVPLTVPRRMASRPQPPVPLVSHERTPPDFAGGMPLIYPDEARRRGWEGRVLLRLHINADGRVSRVNIIRSSGYTILDEAAVRSVRQWQATPAHVGGRPIASVEVLPVRFRLQ